jgi:hypothetical protein
MLAAVLERLWPETRPDRRILVVVSSDLSHYPCYTDACRLDRNTLRAVASLDIRRYTEAVRGQTSAGIMGLSTCACGGQTIIATMAAARSLGAERGTVVSYANSGDALVGDRDRVVGYGAVVFHAGPPAELDGPLFQALATATGVLGPFPKRQLLDFASKTMTQFVKTGTLPLPRSGDPLLCARRGAFVTLRRHGELRGFTGYLERDLPLCHFVGRMALQAAFNDRRFPRLRVF